MLTPARFEDEVNRLMVNHTTYQGLSNVIITKEVFDLMCEALNTLGYGSGVKRICENAK